MKVPRKKPGKEYIRLSFAIFRAKKAGKDSSELLAQRQKLISQRPTAKSREEINRDYYKRTGKIYERKLGGKSRKSRSRSKKDGNEK